MIWMWIHVQQASQVTFFFFFFVLLRSLLLTRQWIQGLKIYFAKICINICICNCRKRIYRKSQQFLPPRKSYRITPATSCSKRRDTNQHITSIHSVPVEPFHDGGRYHIETSPLINGLVSIWYRPPSWKG